MFKLGKLTSIVMALAVLLASNGVVLAVHTCFVSGTVDVSLFNSNNCCSGNSTGCNEESDLQTVVSPKCCKLELDYHKIQVVSSDKDDSGKLYNPELMPISALAGFYPIFNAPLQKDISYKAPPPQGAADPTFIYSIHRLLI